MKFVLKADAVFYATDIDAAFLAVALHFLKLMAGEEPQIFEGGEVSIQKVEE